jgi:hypothetical protein
VLSLVSFDDIGRGKTRVTVEMLPWKSGAEWDTLYKFFGSGNELTLQRARDYLAGKPTDWRPKP